MKTYKYRLYPTEAQEKTMWDYAHTARRWWNYALGWRKYAYEVTGESVGKRETQGAIKHYRRLFAADVPYSVLQQSNTDLDLAYQAFFRKIKEGVPFKKAGYPKFKRADEAKSFGFDKYASWKLQAASDPAKPGRLYIHGIGRIRVRWHRLPDGEPRTLRVVNEAGKWYACIVLKQGESIQPVPTGNIIGIDVGLSHLLATSDGEFYENPKFVYAAHDKLAELQRKLDRQIRANNPTCFNEDGTWKEGARIYAWSSGMKETKRRIQKLQLKISRQRRYEIDIIANWLTLHYDVIAIEDLKIKNMVQHPTLARSILDAGWGTFRARLEQKAKERGKVVIAVDAKYTSRLCCRCGKHVVRTEQNWLSQRWVTCDCGMSLDRDHNAAINIKNRAVQVLGMDGGQK